MTIEIHPSLLSDVRVWHGIGDLVCVLFVFFLCVVFLLVCCDVSLAGRTGGISYLGLQGCCVD